MAQGPNKKDVRNVSGTVSLPTGASTSAKQDTGNTSLSSIDGKITAVNTGAVTISSSALPTGASTAAKQPALGTAGSASTDVLTVQGIASGTAQPISVASLPLPSTAATSTKQSDGTQKAQVVDGSGNVIGATSNALDINIKSGNPTAITANAGTNLNTSTLATEATLAGAIKAEDVPSASADKGIPALAIQTATPTDSAGTDLDYSMLQMAGGRLWVDASGKTLTVASHAVTNAGTFAVQATVSNLPTTVDTNSGNKSASTLRVVLATDQPALTNKLLVTPDSVALPANQSVNTSQINGVTPLMGNGATGTGALRVSIANDSTGVVQPGNTANTTPWLVTDTPATSGGLSIVTGSVGATATAIKASAGQLYGYHLFNTTAAVAYVQIFNTAAASVTLGTTAPVISIGIPASGGVTVNFDKGIAFSTAISFGCTTTRAGASGATVDCNFFYK